ncbi:MAG: gamma-glutamyltransferase [Gammaproteobacteria bacterium]|nr:gamma-glutamyltransferase [Gammaproteobacteria bacterium]
MNWTQKTKARFPVEKAPAIAANGMVVSNNPLGSSAGAELLAAGGNAVDAAVASLFTLTVVEPMMVGIFGAGMSTIRLSDGSHHCINNYSRAPAAASPDMFQPVSDTWPDYQEVAGRDNDIGVLSVGVPGSLKGWCEALEKYGRCSLEEVLQPAIRHASLGFRTTLYLHEIVSKVAADIARFPETAKTYLPGGNPIQPGDRVIQGEYADILQLIAKRGPDVLYTGELGAIAADYIQREGGTLTREDIGNYRTVHGDVIKGSYRGFEIIGPAPPSAGGVQIVEMLNILEAFDIAGMGFGTAESIHLLAEILKLGFEDRRAFTGDPDFVTVPTARLVSDEYAAQRRALIDLNTARSFDNSFSNESNHTTHVTTADADGNVVAATHTLHSAFGSKATVPGTGMLLNNTMYIFDPHPGFANSIAAGKRMTSSMSPVIVEQGGKPVMALGSVGGTRIFPSVFQAIVNVLDHGMTAQEAVEAPRIWTQGDGLALESGVSDQILAELRSLGHSPETLKIIGAGMNMIRFDGARMIGASCWRADGAPVGIGGGMARKGIRFDV